MKPRQIAVGIVLCGLAGAVYLGLQPQLRLVKTSRCRPNLLQISNSMTQYLRDYDEKFPRADNWMDALMPYARGFGDDAESVASVKVRFACPTTGSFYAYNSQIAGQPFNSVALPAPWLFEVSAGAGRYNLSDDGSLWPTSPIHQTKTARGNHVVFGYANVELRQTKPNFGPQPKPTVTPKPRAKVRRKS